MSATLGVGCWLGLALIQQDEELRFRNRLVDWWVAAATTEASTLTANEARARAIAGSVLALLDRLFGPSGFNLRFIVGSLVMFYACAVIMIFAVSPQPPATIAMRPYMAVYCVANAAAVLTGRTKASYALTFAPWIFLFVTSLLVGPVYTALFVTLSVVLMLVDACFVAATRAVLYRVRLQGLALWFLLLFLLPAAVYSIADPYADVLFAKSMLYGVLLTAVGIPMFNNLFMGIGLALVTACLMLNNATWIVLSRIITNLHDRGPTRTQIRWLGVMFIGLAMYPRWEWLAKTMGLPMDVGP